MIRVGNETIITDSDAFKKALPSRCPPELIEKIVKVFKRSENHVTFTSFALTISLALRDQHRGLLSFLFGLYSTLENNTPIVTPEGVMRFGLLLSESFTSKLNETSSRVSNNNSE